MRNGAATAFAHRGCIQCPTQRLLLYVRVYPVLLHQALLSQIFIDVTFRFENQMGLPKGENDASEKRRNTAESYDFAQKSDDLGH